MLSWDPSSDDGVAGYRIYFGTASHAYTDSVDVGVVSSAPVSVPSDATTFYFAATTYYGSGDESDFSNEATVVVPNVAVPPGTNALSSAATLTSLSPEDIEGEGAFGLAVIGLPGTEYVVQASTNLVDWVSVETNTSPFTFEELKMGEYSQRFFRTYTVPAAATVVALPETNRQFNFTVTGTPGLEYVVEASTNLIDWSPVLTKASPFTFVDSDMAKYPQRFFRTKAADSNFPAVTANATVVPAVAATLSTATLSGGNFGINISGTPGAKYVVQASTNLMDWISVQTNASPFTFVDTNTARFSRRFFRAFSFSP